MSEEITARIAVVVDRNGTYAAMGCWSAKEGEEFDWLLDDVEPGENRYFVHVVLRKPSEPRVVEAVAESVTPARTPESESAT